MTTSIKKQKPPNMATTLGSGFNGVTAQDIIDLSPDTITIDDSLITSITVPSTAYTWAQPYSNYTLTGTVGSSGTVEINTDGLTMKETCDIKIGDRSLKEFMDSVEQRLGILRPNPELEDKWENLKGLRKAYMDLEAEILEKEKMWNILKKA
jgi:hypothetical protein